jgi:hypothetical protein
VLLLLRLVHSHLSQITLVNYTPYVNYVFLQVELLLHILRPQAQKPSGLLLLAVAAGVGIFRQVELLALAGLLAAAVLGQCPQSL